jgi:hypothetical protein
LPDEEGGIPAARIGARVFNDIQSFNAPTIGDGSFRRAGSPGSTAGKMPAATLVESCDANFTNQHELN